MATDIPPHTPALPTTPKNTAQKLLVATPLTSLCIPIQSPHLYICQHFRVDWWVAVLSEIGEWRRRWVYEQDNDGISYAEIDGNLEELFLTELDKNDDWYMSDSETSFDKKKKNEVILVQIWCTRPVWQTLLPSAGLILTTLSWLSSSSFSRPYFRFLYQSKLVTCFKYFVSISLNLSNDKTKGIRIVWQFAYAE